MQLCLKSYFNFQDCDTAPGNDTENASSNTIIYWLIDQRKDVMSIFKLSHYFNVFIEILMLWIFTFVVVYFCFAARMQK